MAIRKTAGYAWNLISLVGFILAMTAAGLIVAFFSFELITGVEHTYLGLMTYFLFPGMLVFGLLLVPFGAWRVRNERRKHALEGMLSLEEEIPRYPRLDLNVPQRRHLFIFFIVATAVFVVVVAVASIKGFEFTESPGFCGELCHVPMGPEHTAWERSPHANIRCVECHVGPGMDWYVKAKINGTRQLYGVLTGNYEAPINVPIPNRRSAYETCAKCHWLDRQILDRRKVFTHFAPNAENTRRESVLYLKFGGTFREPNTSGIHWHAKQEIMYIPRGHKHEEIPYVSLKAKDGKIIEYVSTEKPLTKDEIAKSKEGKKRMDCIVCHSRPAHQFRSPSTELDEHMITRTIDPNIPFFKKVALEALSKTYKSNAEASAAIAKSIEEYYAKNYPVYTGTKKDILAKAIKETQQIYEYNVFPTMKVNWATYANNIGHLYFPGCFRCHDGKHKSADGRTISKDCNLCHSLYSQLQENVPAGTQVKNFVHPVDIGDEMYKTNCSDCHGVQPQESEHGGKENKKH